MKLSAAFEASIALSFGDVSDAYQFFPSTLGISDNPDYRANLQHCRITDIDYKRNHAGVSDHVHAQARERGQFLAPRHLLALGRGRGDQSLRRGATELDDGKVVLDFEGLRPQHPAREHLSEGERAL